MRKTLGVGRRARSRSRRPERQQDPRLVSERISAIDGKPVADETWALVVFPVELSDVRVLAFHGPQVVNFNLVEARRYAERGAKARRNLLANLTYRDDGSWGIGDPRKGLDCVSDLATAVQFAYTALEGLGNHTIDQLEPDSKVETLPAS